MLISKCIICTHQICTALKSRIFISKFLWMMCPLWVPTILFLSDSQSLPLSTLWVTRTCILCVGRVGEGQSSYARGIGHLKSWCETDFQFGFNITLTHSFPMYHQSVTSKKQGGKHTAHLPTMFSLCHEMAEADVFEFCIVLIILLVTFPPKILYFIGSS